MIAPPTQTKTSGISPKIQKPRPATQISRRKSNGMTSVGSVSASAWLRPSCPSVPVTPIATISPQPSGDGHCQTKSAGKIE
jgi:hypothetical protein